jgi:hypothetical protein
MPNDLVGALSFLPGDDSLFISSRFRLSQSELRLRQFVRLTPKNLFNQLLLNSNGLNFCSN